MAVTALSLVVAIVLGLLADVVTGALQRTSSGRRRWWWPLSGFATDVRLLVMRRDRISVVEAVWGGLALLGGTLAAAGAVGAAPGNAPFLYLSLALAAVGGHAAASVSDLGVVEYRAARARLHFALAEPAFVLAFVAGFVRWGASDLEAVRGAHDVLGGLEVGPPTAAAGLLLAALVLIAAGSLRLAPERGAEAGAGGGGSLVVTLCRWSLAGATSLAAAAFLMGSDEGVLTAGRLFDRVLLPLLPAAIAGAVTLGGVRALVGLLPTAIRPLAGWAAALLGAVALELVVLA
jgi:hypothetical protein